MAFSWIWLIRFDSETSSGRSITKDLHTNAQIIWTAYGEVRINGLQMRPSVHLASVWHAKKLTPSPVARLACKFNTWKPFNTLRARQNGRLFADDIFKCIFLNENIRISNNILLKFVPKDLSNNIPALVFIMAWRRPGDKPLSEPMMVRSLTHICVSRPQWINKRG